VHYHRPYSCKAADLYRMKVDRTTQPIPEIHSFKIFKDGVRPTLGFGSTVSRSTRSADPKTHTLEPNTQWIRLPVLEILPFKIFQIRCWSVSQSSLVHTSGTTYLMSSDICLSHSQNC